MEIIISSFFSQNLLFHFCFAQVLGNAEATKGSAETEEGSGESSGEEEEGGDSGSEGESEEEEEAMEEDGEANADLEDFERTRQFHILPPDDANGAIMDIQAFCDKRPMYPVSKVLWWVHAN